MVLPLIYGNVYNKRLTAFYVAVYRARFGEFPKLDMMKFYVMLKRVFNKYGELKVASAILMHFEQNGERIISERFPIMWLERNIPEYLQKLGDMYEVNVDDDEELYVAIKNRCAYLNIKFDM